MGKITLSIPKELKEELNKYPEINWTEVLKAGLRKKIEKLEKFEKLEGEL